MVTRSGLTLSRSASMSRRFSAAQWRCTALDPRNGFDFREPGIAHNERRGHNREREAVSSSCDKRELLSEVVERERNPEGPLERVVALQAKSSSVPEIGVHTARIDDIDK